MPLQTAQYTVGTAAVQIISPQNNPTQVLLHNAEKQTTHYIYLGGSSSVTTETTPLVKPITYLKELEANLLHLVLLKSLYDFALRH